MPDPNKPSNFLNPDGTLRIMTWAVNDGMTHTDPDDRETSVQALLIPSLPLSSQMAHSTATGRSLVSNGQLGGDLIRLRAGDGFQPHTHPGDHLLIVVAGQGTITYDGTIYPTQAGEIYMVEGAIPHAVGAITDHVILAVGSPHMPVDSPDRMKPVEYESVTATIESLKCLICNKEATLPETLADHGCLHCPSLYITEAANGR